MGMSMRFLAVLVLFIVAETHFHFFGLCRELDYGRESNVEESESATITVDINGEGNFRSLQAAIDSVPYNNSNWVHILVKPGIYWENITVPRYKPFIYVQGSGMSTTKIVYNNHDTTLQSATITVCANDFVARMISFENTYNHVLIEDGATTQAVAALIQGDRNYFYGVGFYGVQDTLWDCSGRHLFEWCYIEGAIDFIFGAGQSIYENCTINVIPIPDRPHHDGYITAQGRENVTDTNGFVFNNCVIKGTGTAYLGRAWRIYSRVIFYHCYMYDIIPPVGWYAWNALGKEYDVTYVEYMNMGPGSNSSRRVPWLNRMTYTDLYKFASTSYIDEDGWISRLPP